MTGSYPRSSAFIGGRIFFGLARYAGHSVDGTVPFSGSSDCGGGAADAAACRARRCGWMWCAGCGTGAGRCMRGRFCANGGSLSIARARSFRGFSSTRWRTSSGCGWVTRRGSAMRTWCARKSRHGRAGNWGGARSGGRTPCARRTSPGGRGAGGSIAARVFAIRRRGCMAEWSGTRSSRWAHAGAADGEPGLRKFWGIGLCRYNRIRKSICARTAPLLRFRSRAARRVSSARAAPPSRAP